MEVPIPLIVFILGVFVTLIGFIANTGFRVINKNTEAYNKLMVAVENLKTKDIGDEKLCAERHKVINARIKDLEEIAK